MEIGKRKKRKEVRAKIPVDEYEYLLKSYAKSTSRSLTEYIRKIFAGKPVTVIYRDRSLDEFMNELILLREAMEAILVNPNPCEGKDDRLLELYEAIKEKINQSADHVCKNKLPRGDQPDSGLQ
jgi:hypothetical protein